MRTLATWTIDEYHNLIEKGVLDHKPVELLDGELIRMAPEGPIHRYTMRRSQKYLDSIFAEVALLQEGHPITLSNSEPEPDITIFKGPEEAYLTRHPYAQDIYLVIEVSNSTLAYDLTKKKDIYAQENIIEYWVMDVSSKQLHIFKDLYSKQYQTAKVYTEGVVSLGAFPDLQVSVTRLFE